MGWLIACGILLVLGTIPIGVSVKYNEDGFFLHCLLGWIPIRLADGKKKEKKPKKQKKKKSRDKSGKKKEKSREKAKKKADEEKGGSITDFLPLADVGLRMLNAFRRRLRIRRMEMKLILAGDDPCDLAVNYGRAWAVLGELMPRLERVFVIKKRDVEVECDFEGAETVIKARLDIVICLGALLTVAVRYGLEAVVKLLKILKSRKGGASQ